MLYHSWSIFIIAAPFPRHKHSKAFRIFAKICKWREHCVIRKQYINFLLCVTLLDSRTASPAMSILCLFTVCSYLMWCCSKNFGTWYGCLSMLFDS